MSPWQRRRLDRAYSRGQNDAVTASPGQGVSAQAPTVLSVSAEVYLVARDKRGQKLLDQLEERTGVYPYKTTAAGERAYWLDSSGPDGFDAMLGRIDSDWRKHLSRST